MRKMWMMLGLLLPLAASADNLLPNGGFEENSGWKPNGWVKGVDLKQVFAYDTDVKHSGERSLRVMDVWDFARSYPICVVPAVQGAKGYRLTFWARAEKEHTFRAGIALPMIKDGKRRNALWEEREFVAEPEWKQFSMEVPAKAEGIVEVLALFGATKRDFALTGTVWIDDAELVALDYAPKPQKAKK